MIKIYRINDYEWWATRTNIEDIILEWEKITGEEYDIEQEYPYPELCDLKKEGCWDEIGFVFGDTVIPLTQNPDSRKATVGDRSVIYGQYSRFISFKELIYRDYKDFTEPFCIACTEV